MIGSRSALQHLRNQFLQPSVVSSGWLPTARAPLLRHMEMHMRLRVRQFVCIPEHVDTCTRVIQQHGDIFVNDGIPPTWQNNLAQHAGEIALVIAVTGSGAAEAADEVDSAEACAAENKPSAGLFNENV